MSQAEGIPELREVAAEPGSSEPSRSATLLLDGLSSGNLALALILLLILFSLAGAILPQEGLTPGAEIWRWQERYPVATSVFAPLGLFHAFLCWPFLATILALSVNTLTCTILHFRRKGGFAALVGPEGAKRTGFILLHLSLLILFAGGFLSAALKFDGQIILTEGQEFTETHDGYVDLLEGPLRREQHAGFILRLRDVEIEYEKQRYPVSVKSSVDISVGGEQVAAGVVEVNNPFAYEGMSFTQSETGFSPRLEVRDAIRGRLLVNSFIALKTFRTETGREYRDFLPLPFPKQRVVVTLYPSFRLENGRAIKVSDVPDKPLLLLELEDEFGKVVESQQVEVGGRARLGNFTFAFAELRRWTSFRVGQDPGYPLVCVALWLGVAALLLRYWADLRQWFREPVVPVRATNVPAASDPPLPVNAEADRLRVGPL